MNESICPIKEIDSSKKSGSSNLFGEITKSVAPFRIDEFVLISRQALPKRRTCLAVSL